MAIEAAQVSRRACLRLAVVDRDNIVCISMQFKSPVAIHGLEPVFNLLDILTKWPRITRVSNTFPLLAEHFLQVLLSCVEIELYMI